MRLDWALAALPVVLILVLMVGFRWGAAKAGPAGWLLAVILAALRFGTGMQLLGLAHVKALLLALDVQLIIWGAFLLYRVADEAGAVAVISESLPRLVQDRGMQALLIGWPFASFLQGVGGFGVPVAVTAPLLVGLGFQPIVAVVIPSLGHAWSVTFGSLGSSFQALMVATGLAAEQLAPPTAALLGMAGFGCGITAAHAAGNWGAVRRLAGAILLLGAVMGGVQYWLATHELWHLAGFGGSLAGLIVGLLFARQPGGREGARPLALALSAYLVLILITLGVQLISPLGEFLGRVQIRLEFPELRTSLGYVTPAESGRIIPIFRHPGALLAYSAVVGYLIYQRAGRYGPGSPRRILEGTVSRVLPASVAVLALVSMAVVMAHAGMTQLLADGLAQAAGRSFPALSPWIGALGAFMTGSNTNSNVVFGQLQLQTAQLLGLSPPILLAAQTAGGAIGSVFAPSKIVMGTTTAGLEGREGEVLRRLLAYCAILLTGISLVVTLLAAR